MSENGINLQIINTKLLPTMKQIAIKVCTQRLGSQNIISPHAFNLILKHTAFQKRDFIFNRVASPNEQCIRVSYDDFFTNAKKTLRLYRHGQYKCAP